MVNLSLQLEPNADGRHIFLAGQSIKGTIKLSLETPKKFRALYIAVRGRSEIHWTEIKHERVVSDIRNTDQNYRNEEIYLNSKTVLFGSIGGPSIEISAGLHQYSFCCSLPTMLPYSLKAKHGKIEYRIESVLDVPWRFNKECSVPFIVARYDDMNLRNDLKFGQASEEMETFCCCFCSSGQLTLKASIPISGFAIGQNIPIDIEYSNQSDIDVIRTEIKLIKIVKFTSSTPQVKTKTVPETILETFTDGVTKRSAAKFTINLILPTVMHTSNEHCTRILQVSYKLEITAKVSGIRSNDSVPISITIGTSPIILANDNAIRSDFFVQPSAPVFEEEEEMDHGAAFFECNDQEISNQPPPHSTIQSAYPVNMHNQPVHNFIQPYVPAYTTQSAFHPGQIQPINNTIQVQDNVYTNQAFPTMSNVQMTQQIINPGSIMSQNPYSKN